MTEPTYQTGPNERPHKKLYRESMNIQLTTERKYWYPLAVSAAFVFVLLVVWSFPAMVYSPIVIEPPAQPEPEPVAELPDTELLSRQFLETAQASSLTLEAAKSLDILGRHVPTWLPPGYTFQWAKLYSGAQYSQLELYYLRMMADMTITLRPMTDNDIHRIVDVELPETYALIYRDAPQEDGLPYREYPIFHLEDLTLEAVTARADLVSDPSDATGNYISFAVLFESGVLLELNSTGALPQSVYQMFEHMVENEPVEATFA